MEAASSSSHASDDMVNLAVPKKHYPTMVQMLAQLMHADSTGASILKTVPWPTIGEEIIQNEIDWSDVEKCRRLRSWLKNKAALTLLDLAAEKPNEPVYLEEVMARCHCSHGEASSGNGALTKAIRKVFRIKGNWPAPFHWDKEKELAYYVMTPETAAAWIASAK